MYLWDGFLLTVHCRLSSVVSFLPVQFLIHTTGLAIQTTAKVCQIKKEKTRFARSHQQKVQNICRNLIPRAFPTFHALHERIGLWDKVVAYER